MILTVGFIVNPIAGMGGRVGLKGTDNVVEEAKRKGAKPVSPFKAREAIKEYVEKYNDDIRWVTCSGIMGENILRENGIKSVEVIYNVTSRDTSAKDTKNACKLFVEYPVDLIVFCGGDGTARDITSIVGTRIPILGIPSGVKMHSGVFAINPRIAARVIHEFANHKLTVGDVEIMDLDEEKYRQGEWNIKLFGIAKGIVEPIYVQVGKMSFESIPEDDIKDELAEYIEDEMKDNPEYVYFFGSGSTIDYIARKLGLSNTLLGIDAVYRGKTIAQDLDEKGILDILDRYPKAKLILSPIGAQGFILGRGNLQISPKVIRKIGIDNIIVVATPSKLAATPLIRIDTGDKEIDKLFAMKEQMLVIIGYRLMRVVKIQTNNI
ncbi:MAG: ATP-NAD kinase [Thermoplasmata archaeon]|nr:MAG: ATP-NAD kinase [Thermoplasmata archaeon]